MTDGRRDWLLLSHDVSFGWRAAAALRAAGRRRQGRIRSNLHCPDRRAHAGRPAARRSHGAAAPAGRHGPVDRRPAAWALASSACCCPMRSTRCFRRIPEQKAMIDGDLAVRHPAAASAHRHGDRSQAGAPDRPRVGVCFADGHRHSVRLRLRARRDALPDSMLPDPGKRLITSLFLGTALSIASVKIVAMVVREMNFMRRVVGQVILASAIIDDSIGWIIVSIIFSLALHGSVEPISLAQSVIGTVAFMVASLTIGRRAVFFAIRWVNDHLVSEFAVITAILCIMGVMALITHLIGVHTVLGAFVAGILVGEFPDPDTPHRRTVARTDHRFLRAGLFRHCRIDRRSHDPGRSENRAVHARHCAGCQHRKIWRCLHRRGARRPDTARGSALLPAA